ncbi:MAG: tRNA preQ1(34) S-adenosylmethionine ribosyltransferase-isomerase QueA [Saccharofermentanales bacterium]|nr:tRNA preQ1(34) S-adenosylmethionine ribosyltransferase-isomerase QueA [Bacillota bacterium]NLB09405.1 tRNA preQ1(34) S-adenosylmethionine ribosyltransferase-isomerase QueA [Clostridiales bacterium]
MRTADFNYMLPPELIAQQPLPRRDQSRLMVLADDLPPIHDRFFNLPSYLRAGDLLVLNNTKVMPARLIGHKKGGGEVEILLLYRLEGDLWETLVKPGKRARTGDQIYFGHGELEAKVKSILPSGNRQVEFTYKGIWEQLLAELGIMPLPPYIKEKLVDQENYQTVYAHELGSSAAPTAGLHFTRDMLSEIEKKGVNIINITLHIGLGTFRPVREEEITDHKMHSEFFHISARAASAINTARANKNRIVAVGTTSCRVLETVFQTQELPYREADGWTNIFIYPGYHFGLTDLLITNFHLPESTLLMLVSAFVGRERILASYREAIKENYRFFSFGDAMLLIPEKTKYD